MDWLIGRLGSARPQITEIRLFWVLFLQFWAYFGSILGDFSAVGHPLGPSWPIRGPSLLIWELRGGFLVDFGRLWAPFWSHFEIKIDTKNVFVRHCFGTWFWMAFWMTFGMVLELILEVFWSPKRVENRNG